MNYGRPYYKDLNFHPLLFYVIFGVKDAQLNVSRERHHVDAFPEGLDFAFFHRAEHEEYLLSLTGGTLGRILDNEKHALYTTIQNTDTFAVIQGEVQQDADLNYMRNVIGFVQALVEKEAVGVLDLQTFSLFSPEEWTEKIFSQEFNPYSHVTIFTSENKDGSIWLHTRGMRKFGRPDIGIDNIKKNEIDHAVGVANQMVYYGAVGAFFLQPVKLHIHNGLAYLVKAEFIDESDNPDFNNSYYRISWNECKAVE